MGAFMCSSISSFQYRVVDRRRSAVRLVILLVGLLGVASTALASSIRCGVDLVSKGALREEVLAKCGQPYSSSGVYWLYKKGKTVYRVQFNSRGEVRRIKSEIRF